MSEMIFILLLWFWSDVNLKFFYASFAPRLFLIAMLFCVSFVQEADAVVSVLGEMDAWIICPFFLQGGRYTINDIHYVADSDR